jgi:hypothetical protein
LLTDSTCATGTIQFCFGLRLRLRISILPMHN